MHFDKITINIYTVYTYIMPPARVASKSECVTSPCRILPAFGGWAGANLSPVYVCEVNLNPALEWRTPPLTVITKIYREYLQNVNTPNGY